MSLFTQKVQLQKKAMLLLLLRQLIDFKCIHMLHFVLDYLGTLKNVSLTFQREEVFLVTVELHVKKKQ
jgi:hypothetical protein